MIWDASDLVGRRRVRVVWAIALLVAIASPPAQSKDCTGVAAFILDGEQVGSASFRKRFIEERGYEILTFRMVPKKAENGNRGPSRAWSVLANCVDALIFDRLNAEVVEFTMRLRSDDSCPVAYQINHDLATLVEPSPLSGLDLNYPRDRRGWPTDRRDSLDGLTKMVADIFCYDRRVDVLGRRILENIEVR